MAKKKQILVAIDELPGAFWTSVSLSADLTFVRSGADAYSLLTSQSFDLTFVDLHLVGMDGLELLRHIRSEHLCSYVVLTSSVPSFSFAQQGIWYGASAYLLRPIKQEELQETIHRIFFAAADSGSKLEESASLIVNQLRRGDAVQSLTQEWNRSIGLLPDAVSESMRCRDLWLEIIRQTYQTFSWLSLYHPQSEFTSMDYIHDPDTQMLPNLCLRKIQQLNQTLLYLFPMSEDPLLEKVEWELLQKVDSNPQQKEVAEQFYLANSTLSIRFQKRLGITYREYMTRLKICRSRYLLQHTDMPVEALASHLGYKDRTYFAKLYLQQTGFPLRRSTPENWYNYQI